MDCCFRTFSTESALCKASAYCQSGLDVHQQFFLILIDPGKPKWRPANNLPCFEVTKRISQNKVSCITCQVSVRYGKHWHGVSCSADQESPIHCYSICSIMFYVALSFKQQFGAVVFCFLFFAFVWQSRSCECRLTIKINIPSLIAKVCSKTRDYMLSLYILPSV